MTNGKGFRRRKSAAAVVAASAYLAGGGSVTHAQINSDGLVQLEEVVVTAQRRQENLQDVPISVSTMSSDALVKTDTRSLQDLSAIVPGLVASNSVSYSLAPLSIRGVGGPNGGANFFNDEPVAVYLDGMYISRLSFSTADLVDVASIQVLRGPQVTLFGRNATAGALIVTTRSPGDEPSGFFETGADSFGGYQLRAGASGELNSDVSGRFAASWSDRRGYADNRFNGEEIGGSEDVTLRGKLRWENEGGLSVTGSVEYMEREANAALIQVADVFSNPSSPFSRRDGFQQLVDDQVFNLDAPHFVESESLTGVLTAAVPMDSGDVEFILGYRTFDQAGAQDTDSSELSLFTNGGEFENEQITAEVKYTSDAEGPLNWTAGAFYIQEDNAMSPFGIQNIRGFFGLGVSPTFNAFQELDSYAIYADATYSVTEKLSITLGGRYSEEEKRFDSNVSTVILNGGTVPDVPPAGPLGGRTFAPGTPFPPGSDGLTGFSDEADFHDFSPRLVADYHVTDNALVYLSYSQGFKSGGFNSFGLTPAFEPEDIDAYEVGLKSDWLQGRVRANVSGFYYDYSNLQVRLGVPTGGVDFRNAAEAEVQGFEGEFTFLVTDKLSVMANVAYLDATFTEGVLPAVPPDVNFPIGAPVALVDEDISGNRLSRAPEWQYYLAAEYGLNLSNGGFLDFRADLRYQDEVFFLEVNQDQETFKGEAWSELGLRLSYTTSNERLTVSLYGTNILDERYITQITQLGSYPNAALNEPEKYGIDLRYSF